MTENRHRNDSPDISIVIPLHNEEAILENAVRRLIEMTRTRTDNFEIVLVENGSSDRTREIGNSLERRFREIVFLTISEPNYGYALKVGLLRARGRRILSDEIDVLDPSFHRAALAALNEYDLVLASKRHPDASDERGFFRRLGTTVITTLLRWTCGLKSRDTHGPKAWRRETVAFLLPRCRLDADLFASEAVLRAERAGLRIAELPLSLRETRHTPIPLLKRVPRVLRDLFRLRRALFAETNSFEKD